MNIKKIQTSEERIKKEFGLTTREFLEAVTTAHAHIRWSKPAQSESQRIKRMEALDLFKISAYLKDKIDRDYLRKYIILNKDHFGLNKEAVNAFNEQHNRYCKILNKINKRLYRSSKP